MQNPSLRRAISIHEVSEILGIQKSEIYARVNAGTLPPPFKIGQRAVRWEASDIYAALDEIKSKGTQQWMSELHAGRQPKNKRLHKGSTIGRGV